MLSATKVAAEQVVQIADPHLKKGKQLYDDHLKEHVEKHVTAASQVYDKHLKPHVENHILPLHDSHVLPGIAYIQDRISETRSNIFTALVNEFKQNCRTVKPHLDGWLRDTVAGVCREPELHVTRLLWAALIIIIFLTRRLIYRLFVGILWLKLQALWHLTLLPFIFRLFRGRSKPKPDGTDAAASTATPSTANTTKKPTPPKAASKPVLTPSLVNEVHNKNGNG